MATIFLIRSLLPFLFLIFGQAMGNNIANSSFSDFGTYGQEQVLLGETNISLSETQMVQTFLIKVTDSLREPFQKLQIKENMRMQQYKFDGLQWWYETVLAYAYILVICFFILKHKKETDKLAKNVLVGILILMGWLLLVPYLKLNRISIQVEGLDFVQYTNNKIVPQEIFKFIDEMKYDFLSFDLTVIPMPEGGLF